MKELNEKLLALIECEHWRSVIEDFFDTDNGKDFLNKFIPTISKSGIVYPEFKNIFQALNTTKFKDVRVVILGSQPFKSSNARGLAFGLSYYHNLYQKMPTCLQNFEDEMRFNTKDHERFLFDDSMDHWAAQGCLMLNGALTTPISGVGHHALWGWFVSHILQALDGSKMIYWSMGEYPEVLITRFVKKGIIFKSGDPGEKPWVSNKSYLEINKHLNPGIKWH